MRVHQFKSRAFEKMNSLCLSRKAKAVRRDRLTYLSGTKLRRLERALRRVVRNNVPGDIVEFGVALGGSAILLAQMTGPRSSIFGLDVFGMIPEPGSDKDDAVSKERFRLIADGRSAGIGGDPYYGYRTDLFDHVAAQLERHGTPVDDDRVNLVKGLFERTWPLLNIERIAFAHVDCDWYDPVAFALSAIRDRLSPGGVIVVDDYHDYQGCRTAVDEFLLANRDFKDPGRPEPDTLSDPITRACVSAARAHRPAAFRRRSSISSPRRKSQRVRRPDGVAVKRRLQSPPRPRRLAGSGKRVLERHQVLHGQDTGGEKRAAPQHGGQHGIDMPLPDGPFAAGIPDLAGQMQQDARDDQPCRDAQHAPLHADDNGRDPDYGIVNAITEHLPAPPLRDEKPVDATEHRLGDDQPGEDRENGSGLEPFRAEEDRHHLMRGASDQHRRGNGNQRDFFRQALKGAPVVLGLVEQPAERRHADRAERRLRITDNLPGEIADLE